jgi:hypothetical protein
VFLFQGRHTKTGQLAAIKVMDVTEVSSFICFHRFYHLQGSIRTAAVLTGSFHSFKELNHYEFTLFEDPVLCRLSFILIFSEIVINHVNGCSGL